MFKAHLADGVVERRTLAGIVMVLTAIAAAARPASAQEATGPYECRSHSPF